MAPGFRRLRFDLTGRGGTMAALDLGDEDRPFDLVFVHANGFNARTYLELLRPLAERTRILAPDLRGHGLTDLPVETRGRRGWEEDHAADLAALLDAVGGPPVAMSGHSMGGTASLLAARHRPDRVKRLVLLDPVIWNRAAALAFRLPGLKRLSERIPLVQGALRRRRRFEDRDQAFAAYLGRGAFRGWPDAMLRDFLADGLTGAPDGQGLILACTPEWEASNYAVQGHDPWRALDRLGGRVQILKAEQGSTCQAGPDRRRGRRVEVLDGGTHFFPMLRAAETRGALAGAFDLDVDPDPRTA